LYVSLIFIDDGLILIVGFLLDLRLQINSILRQINTTSNATNILTIFFLVRDVDLIISVFRIVELLIVVFFILVLLVNNLLTVVNLLTVDVLINLVDVLVNLIVLLVFKLVTFFTIVEFN
jgi:hypothetical protein